MTIKQSLKPHPEQTAGGYEQAKAQRKPCKDFSVAL
jgi:hypothetical protein